jgi:hypothetical protein
MLLSVWWLGEFGGFGEHAAHKEVGLDVVHVASVRGFYFKQWIDCHHDDPSDEAPARSDLKAVQELDHFFVGAGAFLPSFRHSHPNPPFQFVSQS